MTCSEANCYTKEYKKLKKYVEGLEKPCTTVEYTAIGHWEEFDSPGFSDWVYFEYSFSSPAEVQVFEEYLILDPVGLIRSIGGTLGICIGASIHGFLTFCLHHLVSIIREKAKKEKAKATKSKEEPSNSKVKGSLEEAAEYAEMDSRQ